MAQIRPHVMLVEGLPGDDERIDTCVERVSDPSVFLMRYTNLWRALTTLRERQRALGFGALAVLDLVGHGEAGALSVGDALLSGDPREQRVLAQLLNPPALIDEASVLRLLGCGVGVGGHPADLPLGAGGDGALLAVALKRRLGCRVQVAMLGVDPHDFGVAGFKTASALAEARDPGSCVLVPVTASPAAP